MRVIIDYGLCEGNGICMQLVPEVFEVRSDDDVYVLDEQPPERMRVRLTEAVRSCPRGAIRIGD